MGWQVEKKEEDTNALPRGRKEVCQGGTINKRRLKPVTDLRGAHDGEKDLGGKCSKITKVETLTEDEQRGFRTEY